MLECAEMTRRLATHFYQAVAQLDRPYYKFVGALVGMRLVLAGQSRRMLDPMIGKSLALYYVVAGSKTVPFPEALWTDRQVPNIEDVARQLTGAKAGLDPIGKIGFKPKSDVSEDELDELLDKIEQLLGTRRAPVPSQFQRAFEGRPFDSCDFCRRPLLETGTLYMIIKYHAQKELRQELAICHSCLGELGETYSEKSLKVTKAFYAEGFLEAHRARIRTSPNARVEELTSRCWRCAKERANVSEYFDYAFCDGGEILVYTYPFMQCGNCTLDLVRSLSDQTLEARRRFFADHFGLPPDIYAFEPAEFIMAELP
jgi:hypothetical protein